mmetsp:Transcript_9489/g.18317  ORF Transcript_9489/g.18317 Transcript_9489/m.18317 type:complete len:693 (+) Transcript_9489:3482-5560(+)
MKALQCSVCEVPYNLHNRPPYSLPCSHTYCADCVIKWSRSRSTCPTCCQPFQLSQAQEIYVLKELVGALNVPCDYCDISYACRLCKGCLLTVCSQCSCSHSCVLMSDFIDLTDFPLVTVLAFQLNKLLGSDKWYFEPIEWTAQCLLKVCRDLGKGILKCSRHILDPAVAYRKDKLKGLCEQCVKRFSDRDLVMLPGLEELFSYMAECDNNQIPPLLLGCLDNPQPAESLKLIKAARETDHRYEAYCPICKRSVIGIDVVKYPCNKDHPICKACFDTLEEASFCYYDKVKHPLDQIKTYTVQGISVAKMKCPTCNKAKELRGSTCGHAYCLKCFTSLRDGICAICKQPIVENQEYRMQVPEYTRKVTLCPAEEVEAAMLCECKQSLVEVISRETCEVFCWECTNSHERLTFEKLIPSAEEYVRAKTLEYAQELCYATFEDFEECLRTLKVIPEVPLEVGKLVDEYSYTSFTSQLSLLQQVFSLVIVHYPQYMNYPCWKLRVLAPQHSVLRFDSLFPPVPYTESHRLKCYHPYRIKNSRQVEIVGMMVSRPVALKGLVMGTSFKTTSPAALESFQILKGRHTGMVVELKESATCIFKESSAWDLNQPGMKKLLPLSRAVELEAGKVYIIKFKLKGRSFYSGNQFDTDRVDNAKTGSDGTKFRFMKAMLGYQSAEYVSENAQNHLTGALLGFLYE